MDALMKYAATVMGIGGFLLLDMAILFVLDVIPITWLYAPFFFELAIVHAVFIGLWWPKKPTGRVFRTIDDLVANLQSQRSSK